jgi:hypothetical protein
VRTPSAVKFLWKTESTSKNPTPKRRIDNALGAKITAGVVHNGKRGFHIHILWLYNFSISQSYRVFTDFGGICSGIPRLNTASGTGVLYCSRLKFEVVPFLAQLGLLQKSTCLSEAFSDQIKAPKAQKMTK